MGYISTIRQSYHSLITTNLSYNLIVQTLQAFVSEHGEPWSSHERPIPTLLPWDGPLPLSVSPLNPSNGPLPMPVNHQNPMKLKKKKNPSELSTVPARDPWKFNLGHWNPLGSIGILQYHPWTPQSDNTSDPALVIILATDFKNESGDPSSNIPSSVDHVPSSRMTVINLEW